MDRNQALGLIIISILIIVYFQFLAPQPEIPLQEATTEQIVDSAPEANSSINPISVAEDSLAQAYLKQQLGAFAEGASGEEQEVVLENELVKFIISTKGGGIKSVQLKKYTTYDKDPLILTDNQSGSMDITLPANGNPVALSKLFFSPSASSVLAENDTVKLTMSLNLGGGQLQQVYTLAPDSYHLGYQLKAEGLGSVITGKNATITWNDRIKKVEKDLADTRNRTSINYYSVSNDFDNIGETTLDKTEESPSENLKWVAIKQKFFSSAIITQGELSNAQLSTEGNEKDSSYVKEANVKVDVSLADLSSGKVSYYFGPNDYRIMKKVTDGFEENIQLGWVIFSWINKFVIIQVFQFLELYIGNYGVIIILLVIFIKLILSPLSYKSYLSMAKMKVLKPELDIIKEKYGDDAQKIQTEQMQLYNKAGVSPLSGCIPLLLQMPILFAMFYFFPNSIELRQEAFLWASDLSTYDSVASLPFTIPFYGNHVSLFTILMTASTILYTWSNNQVSSVSGPMKYLSYIMPIMFMFVLNSFPASLSFYYFVSNMVTFGQQALIRQFVDEGKIKAIMDENRKKNVNKKKSAFQQRLEDAMKAGQEAKKK